jgi:C4-dicarboxylate-binding protein DctP
MTWGLRFAATLIAALIPIEGAAAPAPILIKFSYVVAEDTPKGRAVAYFKKLAEERTGGRVRVDVFSKATLYSDKDELEALQLGAVQMLAPTLGNFRALGLSEFEVFDLPYLFDSYEQLRKVTDGPVGASLFVKLEAKGIHGLGYWDLGFKQMSANRALRRPSDFAGLRMRIKSSKVIEAQMRALGATPVTLPFNQTSQALGMGVVEGAENPVSSFRAERMDESQKYLTLSDHGYIGYAVVVNRRFWDKLPGDIRATLEGAMRDATVYANKSARELNDEALAALRQGGHTTVIALSPEEKAQWKSVLVKIHPQFQGRIPRELLLRIYAETGFRPE